MDDAAYRPTVETMTDRITVALVPKAVEDLQGFQGRTCLSRTDIVNRAISLYEFIESQMDAGKDIICRDPKTREMRAVRLF